MIERIGAADRWSDAVIVGNLIFLAGHVAEQSVGADVREQTKEVLALLDDTLAQAGVTKANLASVQIYLSDISTIDQMNEVWDSWVLPGQAPARATVEARLAHSGLAIEITAVAAR